MAHPDTGQAGPAGRGDVEVGEGGDQDALEPAHVVHNVVDAVFPPGEGDDRIADQLTRAVVGDIASAVGADEIGADRRGRNQDVVKVGA